MVAGVIGASTNNAIGIAGISVNVRLMPVKVCGGASICNLADVAAGIRWASDHGAHVITVFPAFEAHPALELKGAVDYAAARGAIVIADTGNAATYVQYPAKYSNVIATGVTDQDDLVASCSPLAAED